MSADEKFAHEEVDEDVKLETLGYQQELKRSFSLLGMIGFSFSIVTSWTALGGVLIVGVESGGPPVMIYSWIGVSIFGLAVAYSMAEMCSAYPLAGGQYSWVAVLAPPKVARGMSWITGWFMIVGILAMGATNNFIGANFILGQANLSFPDYTIERWHTVLLAYLIAFVSTIINIYGPHLLDRISRFILLWNILSFVIVIITILATNDHKQSASFVFSDFQNFTGFNTGYAAILGLLQSSFGMCCYDAPAHMTECVFISTFPFFVSISSHKPILILSPVNIPLTPSLQRTPKRLPLRPKSHHPLRIHWRHNRLHLSHIHLLLHFLHHHYRHHPHRRPPHPNLLRLHRFRPRSLHPLLPHRRHRPRLRKRSPRRRFPQPIRLRPRPRSTVLQPLRHSRREASGTDLRHLTRVWCANRPQLHLLRHPYRLQHRHLHRYGRLLPLLRHAPPRAHPLLLHHPQQQHHQKPPRPIHPRQMGHSHEHHRSGISNLHVCDVQSADHLTRG